MKRVIYLSIILLLIAGCNQEADQEDKREIHISAASSLTGPLDQVKEMFETKYPTRELVINYGSSGALVNQLEQGAPADFLILADSAWMERAVEQNIVKETEIEPILSNRLILAASNDSSLDNIEGLENEEIEKISLGDPKSVPVGTYAKQALIQLDKWEKLEGKLVMAKNARQVAVYLESGNVEAGFLFQSDLAAFSGLKQIEILPASLHDPIVYPAAPVSRGGNPEGGEIFMEYLMSEEAVTVFLEAGFEEIR